MNKLYYYVDCFGNFAHFARKMYNLLKLEKPRREATTPVQQLWQRVCGKKKEFSVKKEQSKVENSNQVDWTSHTGAAFSGWLSNTHVLHTHWERYKHAWLNYLCCSLFLFWNWSPNFFNEFGSYYNFCIVECVLECCRKSTNKNIREIIFCSLVLIHAIIELYIRWYYGICKIEIFNPQKIHSFTREN